MHKRFVVALGVIAMLGACSTSDENGSDENSPQTPAVASDTTTAQATEEPTSTHDAGSTPEADETNDLAYTPATQPDESDGWPNLTAQALPVDVAKKDGTLTIIYDSDGTGELEWYTDGWTSQAFEDGSGFEIDLGTERVLQLWVSGIRYPEADEPFPVLEGAVDRHPIEAYSVSGPFEGMHSITIGASSDMDYAIEVGKDPHSITIHVKDP